MASYGYSPDGGNYVEVRNAVFWENGLFWRDEGRQRFFRSLPKTTPEEEWPEWAKYAASLGASYEGVEVRGLPGRGIVHRARLGCVLHGRNGSFTRYIWRRDESQLCKKCCKHILREVP